MTTNARRRPTWRPERSERYFERHDLATVQEVSESTKIAVATLDCPRREPPEPARNIDGPHRGS